VAVSRNETAGRLIAAAWSNPEFRRALLADPHNALATIGIVGASNVRLIAKANDAATIHLVLSGPPRTEPRSAYSDIRKFGDFYRGDPRLWSLNWRARDPVARQKIVDDPAAELSKMGLHCPAGIQIVVLVNAADLIHIVIPERPAVCSPALFSRLYDGQVPDGLRFGRLFGMDAYGRFLQQLDPEIAMEKSAP
jgi:hypothetical protein